MVPRWWCDVLSGGVERCDVVVIGAGVSGLVAGALLAGAGVSVAVVETQRRPGGYLSGFSRKGFEFDTSIHWLNQCGPGGLVHRIFSHIGSGFPECRPLRQIRRYKGDSFDFLLTDDPDATKRDWIRRFPDERAGIERFFRDAYVIGGRMNSFADLMRAPASMNLFEKIGHGLRMARWGLPFMNKHALTAEQGLGRYFRTDEIRRIFATEESFMSILVPFGWAYHGDFQAPPTGGSQAFPRWLVEQIEAAGSQVILGRAVQAVRVENGVACGVVLAPKARGQTAETSIESRYVIAAGDVLTLYEKLLPEGCVDPSLIQRLRGMDLYDSSVTISIGLDCPAEQLGFGEEMWILTRDDVVRAEQNCTDPERCAISILAPSFRDPTLAPPGKGTLTVYTPADMGYGNEWQTGPDHQRGPEYRAFKKAYAAAILDRVERQLGIDLRGHVEVLDIATPVTHWRYTSNHRGSIMGGRPTKANLKRRVTGQITPVRNLLLAGHWSEIGGGVPVAVRAGANTALLVLKQTNPPAFRRLCATMRGG